MRIRTAFPERPAAPPAGPLAGDRLRAVPRARLGAALAALLVVVAAQWISGPRAPAPLPAETGQATAPETVAVAGAVSTDSRAAGAAASGRPEAPSTAAASLRTAPSLPAARPRLPRFADFAAHLPSPDVRHVADWAVDSGDHQGKAFVIVDKRDATVWLFDPDGSVLAMTPALLGAAIGDDAVPGIGEKPLSEILPEEKTTPAGRYVAEPGVNTKGEDIVWVSYDLAVSLHRVRPLPGERRLERLASPNVDDNRISFGCINLPVAFYEQFLKPAVLLHGAIVYVLPETRTPQQQFGSYDVSERARQLALRGAGTIHVK